MTARNRTTGAKTISVFALALALAASLPAPGRSEQAWLSDADIRAAFDGATIAGHYADGRTFTETYQRDGRLAYTDERLQSIGHWSATAGTLCTIYDGDSAGGCFRVARVGLNCYEFFFVTRTEDAAPGPPGATPAWTARAIVEGRPGGCNPEAAV